MQRSTDMDTRTLHPRTRDVGDGRMRTCFVPYSGQPILLTCSVAQLFFCFFLSSVWLRFLVVPSNAVLLALEVGFNCRCAARWKECGGKGRRKGRCGLLCIFVFSYLFCY
ncbi:hypothetical protein B0H63DRAFT_477132 [Podospora didyma]|uniref:Transmembrane protein n=1 Tax=Podospora didyma TaxID=330526 RepID=A0AAE0NIA1_9PEZI|nr:hypothetical protein B0H63DRAFT_477132 [Podospora didyma]